MITQSKEERKQLEQQEEEYGVEQLLESQGDTRGGTDYLVQWTGYQNPTWENGINFNCSTLQKLQPDLERRRGQTLRVYFD